VSARPARRPEPTHGRRPSPPGALATPPAKAARLERRRREQHLRRRRRDLLEDVGMAIVLMIVALICTGGLGVIALIEIPVGAAVIASLVLERRRLKSRRHQQRRRQTSR
jgi:hypothetical protein